MSSGGRVRAGFTAVELVVVIGIILLLMGMAVPSVLPALRRGSLSNAANDISSCWLQARLLAMTTTIPPGRLPPHFGIVINQTIGERPYVALIFDTMDSNTLPAFLRQGQDPEDASTYDPTKAPIAQFFFNRNVQVASSNQTGSVDISNHIITVYAQYGTGLPIAPHDVALGRGMIAAPTSFGVATTQASTSTVCPVVNLQTPDYVQGQRGYCIGISLYHAGFTAAQSIQE